MWENIDVDRHYTGVFQILDEQISGELIYNKQKGVIMLNIIKEVGYKTPIGKSYADIPIITGKVNSGAVVTFFNNSCVNNHTHVFSSQQLNFVSEYCIWSKSEQIDSKYNKMVCTLKNAFEWSMFSTFEETENGIRAKEKADKKSFTWFGAKITFSAFLN
ncbi:MAG: hypothetical protein MJ210_05650, partial [Alphaproteobacteria bacterium]|nr:hypothetical protein [Alphaproteobacteria bacterium]